eukprot:TRINITY_DN4852_c0_g1_i5.p1 TRINITY_DN4852_c0_g1~~TRINITY_DN4852_c0_g1_i5.p1  ORF type:complete len:602 (+),score=112.21 TRINITY_DN4852_c0_g1_i5:1814-3619(+)
MRWAVSQAAPLRRLHIKNQLRLHHCGFGPSCMASGGFMANLVVGGKVDFGSQQQWFTRNVELKQGVEGGAWNFVFVGSPGAPASSFQKGDHKAISNISRTPVIAEKPFITIDPDGRYTLQIPKVQNNTVGATLRLTDAPVQSVPFEEALGSIEEVVCKTMKAGESDNPLEKEFNMMKRAVGAGVPAFDCRLESIVGSFQCKALLLPWKQGFDPFAALYEVYVARESDATAKIQDKLDAALHVVLTPGIYNLTKSLVLSQPGQTLLGLGMATLMSPSDGSPCVRVAGNVPGVRLAGMMLGASVPAAGIKPGSLIEWGTIVDEGQFDDPGLLFDIFARVGGDAAEAETGTVLKINSGNVIGDHLWLWRADHAKLKPGEAPGWLSPTKRSQYHVVQSSEAKAQHGLEVFGNDVVMYGLQVEHFLQDQTIWYGERGRTFFYQCELPYDVTQTSFADKGYAGYKVNDSVMNHTTYGVGVYSFFRDVQVLVPTAVVVPNKPTVHMVNVFSRFLDGYGGIQSVMGYFGDGLSGQHDLVKEGTPALKSSPTDRLPFGLASEGREIQDLISEMNQSRSNEDRSGAVRSMCLLPRKVWALLSCLLCSCLWY